jgi:hypothetical protein
LPARVHEIDTLRTITAMKPASSAVMPAATSNSTKVNARRERRSGSE